MQTLTTEFTKEGTQRDTELKWLKAISSLCALEYIRKDSSFINFDTTVISRGIFKALRTLREKNEI